MWQKERAIVSFVQGLLKLGDGCMRPRKWESTKRSLHAANQASALTFLEGVIDFPQNMVDELGPSSEELCTRLLLAATLLRNWNTSSTMEPLLRN
jgi:hypothetical protein